MTDLSDRREAILQRVAEIEHRRRKAGDDNKAVEWVDIEEYFDVEDLGKSPQLRLPLQLYHLSEMDYLNQVSPRSANTNAQYLLSAKGWTRVDVTKPD